MGGTLPRGRIQHPLSRVWSLSLREQFRVDLRGIVDILSHHLYSSERVYLRELLQNARDAIEARRRVDSGFAPLITVTPSQRNEPMIVRDNGIGLTGEEMRTLLATIGGSSKRDDFAVARRGFLGQFGIGLLSSFLVADTVEVRSRSAKDPKSPTILWTGHSEGSFSVTDSDIQLDAPGTEIRIMPRHGDLEWCNEETIRSLVADFAELLDVPVRVNGDLLSQNTPPWDLPIPEQLAWCRDRLGFEAMGIVPLDSSLLNVRGLGFVLPYSAAPGRRTGDRIYSNGMLVADSIDQLIPEWAFFCRAVIDAGELPLTASREALQETTSLALVRERLGDRLLGELIKVHGLHEDVYQDVLRLHADGLRALSVNGPDIRALMVSTLPFETTLGERTIEQLLASDAETISYVADADAFEAVRDVAVHAEALVVNASHPHEVDLLNVVNQESGDRFQEMARFEIAHLARPEPYVDVDRGMRIVAAAEEAFGPNVAGVEVAHFSPAQRPVLWWPAANLKGTRRRLPTLVLNADNPTVARLLENPEAPDVADILRALRITGMLLARSAVSVADALELAEALEHLTTGSVSAGPDDGSDIAAVDESTQATDSPATKSPAPESQPAESVTERDEASAEV